jgi:hypothetical protein
MSLTEGHEAGTEAYQSWMLKDLTIQDAITIIAVYAAQMEPEDWTKGIKRIETILKKCEFCVEKKKGIISRINKFTNRMRANPLKTVEIAAKILTPELKEVAFELAVEVAIPEKILTKKNKETLDTLATLLSIDNEFVKISVDRFC